MMSTVLNLRNHPHFLFPVDYSVLGFIDLKTKRFFPSSICNNTCVIRSRGLGTYRELRKSDPSLHSCVALDKLPNLSGPHLTHTL